MQKKATPNNNQGMVYVFTGEGKGKTSAALGIAARAVTVGLKVAMVQWYKETRWPISEHKLPKKLKGFQIYPLGTGFYQLPTDHATLQDHKQAAQKALAQAHQLLPKVDVLILDEINNAIADSLIDISALINLISKRGKTHLILTGRKAHPKIIALADLVTEMKAIKHPFNKGQLAIKGLDF